MGELHVKVSSTIKELDDSDCMPELISSENVNELAAVDGVTGSGTAS